ncbi:hypothetical protein [Helicobacter sp.]|uniref:hypothetical protein n=1 Tax=Helicobacter sp. TaxID=218 RepID=UPI002A749B45|nr:hypothetical protein [Helicobacter sp.]MDY2584163.1 hypothetical protein [Helicobacter sp.]
MEFLNQAIENEQATQEEAMQEAVESGVQTQESGVESGVQTQEETQEHMQEQTQENQKFDTEQLNLFAKSLLEQMQANGAMQNGVQESTENAQTTQEIPQELQFIAQSLGIASLKEEHKALQEQNNALKQIVESMQQEAHIAQVKAQIAQMESTMEGFKGEEIYNYLLKLNKTNPAMAQALDNPQGWEMIHKSLQAGGNAGVQNGMQATQVQGNGATQAKPDFILSGTQKDSFEPNALMEKIKSGQATYAEMGKLFI